MLKLNDRYDAADINIRWLIYFKIKRWDDNNYVDHSENAIITDSYSMTKDGERTLHMYYKYSNANSLDPSTLTDIGFYAVGIGTYYKYIYYK